MKLQATLSTLIIVSLASVGFAQRRPPIVSPEIGSDGKVTLRIDAPKAAKVEVAGQWPDGNKELAKNGDGIWEIVFDTIPAGIWEYSLRVDGLSMIDPNNSEIKPMRSPRSSILHIPGKPPMIHDFQDVPHGAVHLHTYQSKAVDRPRRLAVYTPPGYEQHSSARYPTLYLQHGSGDNEATWIAHGKAHWIADNLIATKKAKPMIIVMMDGHIAPPTERTRNTELFEKELLEEVIPFVEANYAAEPSAGSRGIVGLSMGGGQSLTVGLKNTDKFAWVGGFSSAVPGNEVVATAIDNSAQTNERLKLLWIGCGKDDFLIGQNEAFVERLTSKGVKHQWHKTDGNHSWPIWRVYLADFLPELF